MENTKKRQDKKLSVKIWGILLSFCLVVTMLPPVFATAADDRKLQNGSFEEGGPWNNTYQQPHQSAVPAWNTTAFEEKIELFKSNTGTYITGVTLNPTHPKDSEGKPVKNAIAAELNADEESTLYQNVKTTPSSVYEWGLDHGARNGKDIMALVIGPAQNKPDGTSYLSKPSKDGRDQMMQMVDWLNISNNVVAGAEPKQYTVYSKKFAANGTFADNAGNNAFSLTPSTIYTEEWHIWIMASSRATSGTNPWNSYGSNAAGSAGSGNGSGSTTVDLSKYYLYTVPAGQTETLFGFVSVGYEGSTVTGDKAKTYGNFLDNINFQLYHPLSGSTTTHGSAVVGDSNGTTGGEGSSSGHTVTVDGKLATYVTDGEALIIRAIVKKTGTDADDNPTYDGCEFVGVYYTKQDENGNPHTVFLQLAGNAIEDTGSLTDEQKKGTWIKSKNKDDDIIYTYYLENLTSATDLHFVFIKNPTITYDPNGGKLYDVGEHYDIKDGEQVKNVYSFKPDVLEENISGVDVVSGATPDGKPTEMFIPPYVSHAAEAPEDKDGNKVDGWKFMGWLLTGDTVENVQDSVEKVNADKLGSLILPAEHTVACDYSVHDATQQNAAQYFKIYGESVTTSAKLHKENNEVKGVTWTDNGETKVYANIHKGLTMVAQWRWRQAFIPQTNSGDTYTNSDRGGTVEITSVTSVDKSDERYKVVWENYDATYNAAGGKSYHAETDETITVKATPNTNANYTFEGWYDASGKLVTTNPTYTYVETKESVNTYYARFSGSVTQTYIRQVKNGDSWENTSDDKIGILDRYIYSDAPGTNASSTATAGSGYKFVGWYDVNGNEVANVINNGATISYTTTGDATYYARFETAYTVYFVAQTQQENGNYQNSTTGGSVSVASVKDVNGKSASSRATATQRYQFVGWYDASGTLLSTNATYTDTITPEKNGKTYYARFNILYTVGAPSLSFVAESEETAIPDAFAGRHAGTGKNTDDYGLQNRFGNTIATGFPYSIVDMTNVNTIQINVSVPKNAYVKVGGTGGFAGNGNAILTDSEDVTYNKGSIQQIKAATTLTYYWKTTGLKSGQTYGFIIDNLYAPGATATITINGTSGIEVTSANGVVNTAASAYRANSRYSK